MSALWREWVFGVIINDPGVAVNVTPDRVFGAGALRGIPSAGTPFIVIGFGPDIEDPGVPTTSVTLDVSCHDKQRTYKLVDVVLDSVRKAVVNAAPPVNSYPARPIGRSADLADDIFDTLLRTESFRLISVREAAAIGRL